MFKECPKLVVLWPASRNSLGRKFHDNIPIISGTSCFLVGRQQQITTYQLMALIYYKNKTVKL